MTAPWSLQLSVHAGMMAMQSCLEAAQDRVQSMPGLMVLIIVLETVLMSLPAIM